MQTHSHSIAGKKYANIFKTGMIMVVFAVVIIGLGLYASQTFGSPVFLYGAIGMSLIMNIVSYYFSDKMAIAQSGARPVSREEAPVFYEIMESLTRKEGVPMPRLYLVEDSAPNAFATGRSPSHAVIAVTSGLLRVMNRDELEGVLAHELAHVTNRDILVSSVAIVFVGIISVLVDVLMRASLFSQSQSGEGNGGSGLVGGALYLVGSLIAPFAAQLLFLAISRKRESLADLTGSETTGHPHALASALEKIAAHTRMPLSTASNTTAHLYISNPFGPDPRGQWVQRLFMSHPPIEERIATLRSL